MHQLRKEKPQIFLLLPATQSAASGLSLKAPYRKSHSEASPRPYRRQCRNQSEWSAEGSAKDPALSARDSPGGHEKPARCFEGCTCSYWQPLQ